MCLNVKCRWDNAAFLLSFSAHLWLYLLILTASWGAGTYLQRSLCKRQCTLWTSHQSTTGQHRDTPNKQPHMHVPIHTLEQFREHRDNMQTPGRDPNWGPPQGSSATNWTKPLQAKTKTKDKISIGQPIVSAWYDMGEWILKLAFL